MILAGLGASFIGSTEERGDHIVTLKLAIPNHLDAQQRQALQAYAKIEPQV